MTEKLLDRDRLKAGKSIDNRPRSIYQYSDLAPRLSRLTSLLGVAFFLSKSLLGIERQKKLKNLKVCRTRKPQSYVKILIYQTWPINNLHFRAKYFLGAFVTSPAI